MPPRRERPSIVLDTNVIIAAVRAAKSPDPAQSAAWQVVSLWKRGFLQLVVSPDVVTEYLSVLGRFRLSRREVAAWARWFSHPSKVTAFAQPRQVRASRDPKDDPFLGLALTAQAAVIVSRDEDLLVLSPFEGIEILTPADYLEHRRQSTLKRRKN